MTKKQENKLTMYVTVVSWLDKNLAQVQHLPLLTKLHTELKGLITDISNHSTTQGTGITGLAKQKDNLKKTLVDSATELLIALQAFAALTDNVVLTGEVNYTFSKLNLTSDVTLSDKTRLLLTKGKDNLTALAEYDITQAMLDDLQKSQTAFMTAIADPRNGTITRKEATNSLSESFAKLDDLLTNKLDKVMKLLRTKDATTYSAYLSARKIVNK